MQRFERFLSDLLTTITVRLNGELNLLFIDSIDLLHIQESLQKLFSIHELLPFNKLYHFETIDTIKLNTIVIEDEIIFVLKVPVFQPTLYNYRKIYPTIFGQKSLLLLPSQQVFEHKQLLFV